MTQEVPIELRRMCDVAVDDHSSWAITRSVSVARVNGIEPDVVSFPDDNDRDFGPYL